MWYEILKKDLKKRKSINLILFFFILLSTVFLASSANNIIVAVNGIDNYMKYANVSDVMLVMRDGEEREELENWLDGREEVTDYTREKTYEIKESLAAVVKGGRTENFEANGNAVYLGSVGAEYAKPLDTEGNELKVKEGEVAISPNVMRSNGLEPGDELKITLGGETYTYKITQECMDILWGNDMSGMLRFIFSPSDYKKMAKGDEGTEINIYAVKSNDIEATLNDMGKQHIDGLMTQVLADDFAMLYVFEIIMPALLVVMGICLILISLMILRFSLVFTMEENYREIGVMKAIGMRNFSVRKIYLVKYMAMVIAGAVLGFIISIPVSEAMIKSVSRNMVIGKVGTTWFVNLLSSAVIIIFVAFMCMIFTGKIKKISAIEAIRSGEKGERYHRRRGLSLHRKKYMGTVMFLGLNDILSSKKRYIVLLVTFCISFVLITVPLNTYTTMNSREMAEKFNLNPNGAVFIDTLENDDAIKNYHSVDELKAALERVENEMKDKGYDAKLSTGAFFFFNWEEDGEDWNVKLLSYYPVNTSSIYGELEEGDEPRLGNEVAFSKKIMTKYNLKIGDTVKTKVNGEERQFIITGMYTDYMQLGESARLSAAMDVKGESMAGYWKTTVELDTELSQEEMAEKLKKEMPDYTWTTAQEAIDANVGGIKSSMRDIQLPMTAMLCLLIMLITMMMMRLFIVREQGQIAMLKSIGCRDSYIRKWLSVRMVWVVVISMVGAVPLSMLSNRFVLTPIFAIMGAELKIQVEPLQAYIIYPGILLVSIIAAAVFATGRVKKITVTDMKAAE